MTPSMDEMRAMHAVRELIEPYAGPPHVSALGQAVQLINDQIGTAMKGKTTGNNTEIDVIRRVNISMDELDGLRRTLKLINMLACYACEEDTTVRYEALLEIGRQARMALGEKP